MSDEPFLLLNLKEDKTKKLATALANKSANKILTYLASKKSASETEIAKDLSLTTSTVNYTIKALVDAKLAVAEEYTYSKKGRVVNQYKLAKKYIIIAPDDAQDSFLENVKKFLPATLLAAGIGAVVSVLDMVAITGDEAVQETMALSAKAMPMAENSFAYDVGEDAAQLALEHDTISPFASFLASLPEWLIPFLIGVGATFVALIAYGYVRKFWKK